MKQVRSYNTVQLEIFDGCNFLKILATFENKMLIITNLNYCMVGLFKNITIKMDK